LNDAFNSSDNWSQHLVWGAPEWIFPAGILAVVLTAAIGWSYARSRATTPIRVLAATLKLIAVALMLLCLLQPMWRGERPRPQANQFPILVDTSQSMQLQDVDEELSRGQNFANALAADSDWRVRLEQTFDVRLFGADSRLSRMADIDTIEFDGMQSSIQTSIDALSQRLKGRPVAGALLFSDGNLTDPSAEQITGTDSPFPIFPVLPDAPTTPTDLRLERVSVTQSDFETSPMTVRADVMATGLKDQDVVVQLLNASGTSVEEKTVTIEKEGELQSVTFRFRPEQSGTQFYRVLAFTPSQRQSIRSQIDEGNAWLEG